MRKTLMGVTMLWPLLIISATARAQDGPKLEGYQLAEKYYREIINRAMDPTRQARVEEDDRKLLELIKRLLEEYPVPAPPVAETPVPPKVPAPQDKGQPPQAEPLRESEDGLQVVPADDEAAPDWPPDDNQDGKGIMRDKAVVPAAAIGAASDHGKTRLVPLKTQAERDDDVRPMAELPAAGPVVGPAGGMGEAFHRLQTRLEALAQEVQRLEAEVDLLRQAIAESPPDTTAR